MENLRIVPANKLTRDAIFGIEIYYSEEMGKTIGAAPFRINNTSGQIEVNRPVFSQYSEAFQYFMLKWAGFMFKFRDHFKADSTSLYDMMGQFHLTAQQRVTFLNEFINLFSNGNSSNSERIKAISIELIKMA